MFVLSPFIIYLSPFGPGCYWIEHGTTPGSDVSVYGTRKQKSNKL